MRPRTLKRSGPVSRTTTPIASAAWHHVTCFLLRWRTGLHWLAFSNERLSFTMSFPRNVPDWALWLRPWAKLLLAFFHFLWASLTDTNCFWTEINEGTSQAHPSVKGLFPPLKTKTECSGSALSGLVKDSPPPYLLQTGYKCGVVLPRVHRSCEPDKWSLQEWSWKIGAKIKKKWKENKRKKAGPFLWQHWQTCCLYKQCIYCK